METITISEDIQLLYVEATSFPEGIAQAQEALYALIPPTAASRRYFGLSRPENGTIVYKAAAEVLHGSEAATLNLKTIALKKGKYICEIVKSYAQDIAAIDRTFQQLMEQPGIDPQGYCVEWYYAAEDVQCMIRLAD